MSLDEICLKTNLELQERVRLCDAALSQAEAEVNGAYTERARLLALLATIYPSHFSVTDDCSEAWPGVLCVHFPWGQASWHLSAADVCRFPHTEVQEGHCDGHTTAEKYDAIAAAVQSGAVLS